MGLDIGVWRNIKKVSEQTDESIHFYNEEGLSQNVSIPGYYEGERDRSVGWHGPYSYYGRFRRALCLFAIGLDIDTVWKEPKLEYPFIELINFFDNEGVYDTDCCKRLYQDFLAFKDKAQLEGDFFWSNYSQFLNCFKVASENNGCVEYH